MTVTKYLHSCLLIELGGKHFLIDPGIFSWQAGVARPEEWQIDYILITHMHPDHCSPDFIRAVLNHSPDAQIFTNQDVMDNLAENGLMGSQTDSISGVNAVHGRHAPLWGGLKPPQNTIFTIADQLTHVGDTHDIVETAPVLALPIYAPWGSFKSAMEVAMAVKPRQVLPIHDWFFSDAGRDWHYQRAKETLEAVGIEFTPLETGIPLQIAA